MVHLARGRQTRRTGAGFLALQHPQRSDRDWRRSCRNAARGNPVSASRPMRHRRFGSSIRERRFSRAISCIRRLAGRVVESQPGLPDAWEAPFLYEDSRNVFFVKAEELAEPLDATPKRFGLRPSVRGRTRRHGPSSSRRLSRRINRGSSTLDCFDGISGTLRWCPDQRGGTRDDPRLATPGGRR